MGSRIVRAFVFMVVLVFVFALWSSVAAAPAVTIQPSHYARLGSLTAAEAASLGNIAPAAGSQGGQARTDFSSIPEEIRAANRIQDGQAWNCYPPIPEEIRAADRIQGEGGWRCDPR